MYQKVEVVGHCPNCYAEVFSYRAQGKWHTSKECACQEKPVMYSPLYRMAQYFLNKLR